MGSNFAHPEHFLTGEKQPELSPHTLRNPLENEFLRLLCAVHTHPLSVLGKVVLPCLLFQKLLRLIGKATKIYMQLASIHRAV